MTRPRARDPLQFPPGYRPSPAEAALARSGFTVREAARMCCRSPRSLQKQLRANSVKSHFVASVLAALCETSVWTFSPRALAPENEEPR